MSLNEQFFTQNGVVLGILKVANLAPKEKNVGQPFNNLALLQNKNYKEQSHLEPMSEKSAKIAEDS